MDSVYTNLEFSFTCLVVILHLLFIFTRDKITLFF